MKKFFFAFVLAAFALTGAAQRQVETVYLKNGSVIKGEVIEQVPGQSLKIRTRDGSIFVYQMDEVERITKEERPSSGAITEGLRGLDFGVDLGLYIPTKSGLDVMPSIEFSLGKRFSPQFYAGIGTGVYIPTSGSADWNVPITANAKVFFSLNGTNIMPFGDFKFGYVFNTGKDESITTGTGKYRQNFKIEKNDFLLLQLMPGVQIPLSGGVDFRFAAGYAHWIPLGGGDGFGTIAINAGFDFHKGGKKRQIVPTRNKGLQLTLEVDAQSPWQYGDEGSNASSGANVLVGYKLNPNISVGLGFGVSYAQVPSPDIVYYKGTEDERVSEGESYYNSLLFRYFLRGQYRLNDNRFSPFASLDFGIRSFHDSDWEEYETNDSETKEWKSVGFFVRPAVGVSLRTTNNSYVEARVGYSLSSKLKGCERDDYYHYGEVVKDVSTSGLFFTIGWTHTFGWPK